MCRSPGFAKGRRHFSAWRFLLRQPSPSIGPAHEQWWRHAACRPAVRWKVASVCAAWHRRHFSAPLNHVCNRHAQGGGLSGGRRYRGKHLRRRCRAHDERHGWRPHGSGVARSDEEAARLQRLRPLAAQCELRGHEGSPRCAGPRAPAWRRPTSGVGAWRRARLVGPPSEVWQAAVGIALPASHWVR